jgi:hypothetical protein
MLTIRQEGDLLHLELKGTITRDDIAGFSRRIEPLIAAGGRYGLVVDMAGMTDMTADAIVEDLKVELALLDDLDHFPRMAVISDKQWVAALVRFAAPWLPKIEVQSFTPEQAAAAAAFAAGFPRAAPPPPRRAAARRLETGSDRLYAFEIDGRLGEADIDLMLAPLTAAFERGEKIDVLLRIRDFEWFEAQGAFRSSVFSAKMAALRHLRRYAIVGAPDWMEAMIRLTDRLTAIEMRAFDDDEEDEAWAWIRR